MSTSAPAARNSRPSSTTTSAATALAPAVSAGLPNPAMVAGPGSTAARLRATARGVLPLSHPDERVHDRPVRPGPEEFEDLLGWLALAPLGLELLIGAAALQPRRYLRGPLGLGRVRVDVAATGEHDP